MASWRDKLALIAQRNRQEIVEAKLSRREMVKLGLLTAAGTLVLKGGLSAHAKGGDQPASPPTRSFVVDLPIPPIAEPVPVTELFPQPLKTGDRVGGEALRDPHPFIKDFPPTVFYDIHEQETLHSFQPGLFRPDLPDSTVWRFAAKNPDGTYSGNTFLGPTILAQYGKPVLARISNDLPANHVGFGMPQTSTHLHSGHIGSESDGFPTQFYPTKKDPHLLFKDFHFPNFFAGAAIGADGQPGDGVGDSGEALSTLWYHDHRVDFTAQNVYKGLAGSYLLFDKLDSGNETDPFPALGLPGLPRRTPDGDFLDFDVPLIFSDAVFDAQGQLFFDQFNNDGILGDKFLVNGAIQPKFRVARRKYRFRMCNASLSRYYEFFRSDGLPFIQIGSDAALLPAPINPKSIRLGMSERADVIIDFSVAKLGDHIFLQNRLVQDDGRGPSGDIVSPGTSILRFDVDHDATDSRPIPTTLRPLPRMPDLSQVKQRVFELKRDQGAWSVNGRLFDANHPFVAANPRRNVPEIWTFRNSSGGWSHPTHVHTDEFRLLSRNGQPPRPQEVGRKDSFDIGRNEEVRILVNFRDFLGQYVMHCHNIVHEDHAMMGMYEIVP